MRPELIQASELLRRATPESVEQAVSLLQNTVYSFSMKVCGHREDAEDTMQDVLLGSMRHLARFPDPNALAAWLYTVTRNRCRRMRRNQRETTGTALSMEELMPAESDLRQLMEQASSPETGVLREEEHHLLHKAVLRIPPSLRVVLVLHDMEELSTEQVAGVLGLQTGTVRVRLHRARLTVRKEMADLLSHVQKEVAKPARTARRSSARKATPECRKLFAELSEYLDGHIEPIPGEQMQAHIENCPECVAFLKDLRLAIDRCKSLSMQCDPAVAARMRSLLTSEYLRLLGTPAR